MSETLEEFMVGRKLFQNISSQMDDPWLDLTGDSLDQMLVINYGNREVWYKFENLTDREIGSMVAATFGGSWNALIQSTAVAVENSRRELTETISQTDVRNGTTSETSKVSAFNSNELVDDEGRASQSSDGLDSTRTRTLTDENIDVARKLSNLEYVNKQKVVQSVLKDVASYLTLSIY